LAIDADFNQVKCQNLNVKSADGINLIHGNFKDIEKIAKENNFYPVDGILFDLGLSMRQLNESGKGFSYKKLTEGLDMRLDGEGVTAGEIINSYSKDQLYEIFSKYSEELDSWPIAQSIIDARRVKKIMTVGDLILAINKVIKDEKVYSRIFQALRIETNDELESLKKGLSGAINILKKDGQVAIITFHSLEDRIVKKFVRENNLRQVNKKVVKGSRMLRFERSAKLRIICK